MGYKAKVVADSVSPAGVRLTTLEVTMPRIVLAEFNTHRMLCLAGDAELEFDLPTGTKGRFKRVHRMRIDDFVDKWLHGARRYAANPKREVDLSWVESEHEYCTGTIAAHLGMATTSNLNLLCRDGALPARKVGREWLVSGKDVVEWRRSTPEHTRFDIRARLASMRIRQLNEETGDVQWSHVVSVCESGTKEVLQVIAGDYAVAGSRDHRVLTVSGYKSIGDLQRGDMLVVRKFGKRDEDKLDPTRLKKIDGVWRNGWQKHVREEMVAEDPLCRRCRIRLIEDIHHVIPVHVEPSLAIDRSNVTALCGPCHAEMHSTQGWQGGTYLYGAAVAVEDISVRGVEPTYDLEIAGPYPNFLANGVVVHNSRSSASSRAIPVEKRIAMVEADPFVPEAFGRNQRGMQAGDALSGTDAIDARSVWLGACEDAVRRARALAEIGVHKQIANRLIEPFLWHTVLVTATEWSNFFALRCHPDAQPEIRKAAEMMRDAMAASKPLPFNYGEWHTPFVEPAEAFDLLVEGMTWRDACKVSIGRCARVSYLTHDGRRAPEEDVKLADRLSTSGHMSPFEHVARPFASFLDKADRYCPRTGRPFVGNFAGWVQYRKGIANEDDFGEHLRQSAISDAMMRGAS